MNTWIVVLLQAEDNAEIPHMSIQGTFKVFIVKFSYALLRFFDPMSLQKVLLPCPPAFGSWRTSLRLGANKIGPAGVEKLVAVLPSMPNLEEPM